MCNDNIRTSKTKAVRKATLDSHLPKTPHAKRTKTQKEMIQAIDRTINDAVFGNLNDAHFSNRPSSNHPISSQPYNVNLQTHTPTRTTSSQRSTTTNHPLSTSQPRIPVTQTKMQDEKDKRKEEEPRKIKSYKHVFR